MPLSVRQPAGRGRLSREELRVELERARERIADLEADRAQLDEHRLDNLAEHMQDGLLLLSPEGVHLDVNPALCAMVGYTREELVGVGLPHPYWPPEEQEAIARGTHRQLEGATNTYEETFMRRDGERFPVLITPSIIRDEAGGPVCAFAIIRDISEQRRADEALRRATRELRALSSCNQALLRAADEETLLKDVCRIVCDEAVYRMAWVGYAEHDAAETVRPVAWAGVEAGCLATVDITWADEERGRGPAGTCVRTGSVIYTRDFASDQKVAPWREGALRRGYRSAIALPLKDENAETFGALIIYSAEPAAFTPDEVRLLEELAANLAFGITVLRTRAEREQSGNALHQSETQYRSVVENAPVGVFQSTLEGQFVYVNPACASMFGAESPTEMIESVNRKGIGAALYENADDRRQLLQDVHAAGGEWVAFKIGLHHKDGSLHVGLIYMCECLDLGSGELNLFGFVQDVTVQEETIKERERSARLLAQGESLAHLGSWEWEAATGMYLVSEEWQRLHGIVGSVLSKDEVNATCHEDDRAAVEAAEAAAAAGGLYRVDHRVVHPKTHKVRHLKTYGEPLFDAEGHLQAMIGASLDVTERVHADEALRERKRRLQRALDATVDALGATLTMRDPYTSNHQRRVAALASEIAEGLGWSEEAVARVRTAALVHDIGKIAVPAEILSKPTRLTETEFELIKAHTAAAYEVLAPIDFGSPVAEIVLQHHERLDGSGYPRGLRGDEILPAARVLAVADVVEAMITHRPYRAALTLEEALAEVASGGGVRYDPEVAEVCRRLFMEEGFTLPE